MACICVRVSRSTGQINAVYYSNHRWHYRSIGSPSDGDTDAADPPSTQVQAPMRSTLANLRTIILCSDVLSSKSTSSKCTLIHELIHAFDACTTTPPAYFANWDLVCSMRVQADAEAIYQGPWYKWSRRSGERGVEVKRTSKERV
jgi:hypothetical protein